MYNKMGEQAKKCIELYEKMSPEMQSAILWVLMNRQLVKQICCGKNMPEKRWIQKMKQAEEKEDMLAIVLLECKKIFDDKKRQENCQDEE